MNILIEKSLERSLLAVAAAADHLLKIERLNAAAFLTKKTVAMPLFAGDDKTQPKK